MVEVAGGFNGWHQTIKMDLQSSSATLEPVGSRCLITFIFVHFYYFTN